MSKKYAVLWCADYANSAPLKTQMIKVLTAHAESWHLLDPMAANFAEQAYGYDGYVISGSAHSVTDTDSPLVINVLRFLQEIRTRSRAPVVGICFGAQAIAHAYGGQVKANRGGRLRLGVESLTWTLEGTQLIWPQEHLKVNIAQSHFESVHVLPADARVLASSTTTENEIFLVAHKYLGIQGHPEIDNDTLSEVFLAFHQTQIDEKSLQAAKAEAERPLQVAPVIGLIQRILDKGAL